MRDDDILSSRIFDDELRESVIDWMEERGADDLERLQTEWTDFQLSTWMEMAGYDYDPERGDFFDDHGYTPWDNVEPSER